MSLQNPDRLITGSLEGPLLDEFYAGSELKGEVVAIAEEIKRRYLAKLAPHTDTGRLASTARVTTHRSTVHPDRRWEAEFSVGGGRADYADDLEAEFHLLSSVLNDMGFFQGDSGGSGPTGKIPTARREPASADAAIRRFTNDPSAINNRLRNAGDPLLRADPSTDRDIRELRRALANSQLTESMRVFRTHSAAFLGDLNDAVGKTFPQAGFISSSSDPTFLDSDRGPGQVGLELEVSPGVRARDVSGLSDFGRGESEVLIEPGRNIRITHAETDSNGNARLRGVVE